MVFLVSAHFTLLRGVWWRVSGGGSATRADRLAWRLLLWRLWEWVTSLTFDNNSQPTPQSSFALPDCWGPRAPQKFRKSH